MVTCRRVRVAGDVWAVFEHIEPRTDGLPSWLALDCTRRPLCRVDLAPPEPSPRVVRLHFYIVTSDLNLQTKLAVVGLPFVEPSRW